MCDTRLLLFHFAYELIPRWIYTRVQRIIWAERSDDGTRNRRMNSTLVAATPPPLPPLPPISLAPHEIWWKRLLSVEYSTIENAICRNPCEFESSDYCKRRATIYSELTRLGIFSSMIMREMNERRICCFQFLFYLYYLLLVFFFFFLNIRYVSAFNV